jgi:hypothetical protein
MARPDGSRRANYMRAGWPYTVRGARRVFNNFANAFCGGRVRIAQRHHETASRSVIASCKLRDAVSCPRLIDVIVESLP